MSVPFPPHRRIPSADALASAPMPRRVREALQGVYAALHELVVEPLDRLIPQVESRIGQVRVRGPNAGHSSGHHDPAATLALRQAAFIAQFGRAIDAELASLRQRAREPARAAETLALIPTFEELRLVEEDEADEATEAKAIALRHESRAALPVHLLCQRFAVLAESPAFEPGRLPVGPHRLCELMLAAGEACGFDLSLRIALLREFDRGVLVDYPAIAEAINDLLARLRIMPGLSYVPLRPRARVAAIEQSTVGAERERPHTGWTGAAPSESETLTFQMLQELLASRRTMADRFRGGFASPPAAGPDSGGGPSADGGGAPSRADLAPRARPELPTPLLAELLASANDDMRDLDIEGLRQWVLLQGRARLGEPVVLLRADADIFELLGLMLAHIEREVRPDAPAATMLARLRLPLLRLALADAGFFTRAAHPAREVLNAVAESGARWYAPDDVDPQLLLHLERIVDGIARAHDDVGAAFRAAVAALEPQLQAVARRSEIAERRNVEAARGKDRLAVARHRATAAIDEALTTARVPVFHRGMLRQAWADVLTLAHLRHGEDSAEWTTLTAATADLVRASAGEGAASPDLVLLVDQWLETVGYHDDDAHRVARLLTGTDDASGDDAATRTELAMRLKARARLGEDALGDGADGTVLDGDGEAQAQRLRELPPGTWLEVPDAGGAHMRRRLSWLSTVTGLALLVNPRGQRVADTTIATLARDLSAGRARVVTAGEGRLVDRAWQAALRGLGGSRREAE